jgi:uncharacterized repeat protein (TIGR03803 family)
MKSTQRTTSTALAALTALAMSSVALPAAAQSFTVLKAFGNGTPVLSPRGVLAQGQDGLLYGTSLKGGSLGEGTVFAMTPGGDVNVVGSFSDITGGTTCNTGLSLGRDGSFYGTCADGKSPFENGTVFSASTASGIATLHAFDGKDGTTPEPGVPVQGVDGNFYGMTEAGGANGDGTVFVMHGDGSVVVLYNFGGFQDDGREPSGSLNLASDGNFYGTTMAGGKLGGGTVFKMTSGGQVTILHDFPSKSAKEGVMPMGGVVEGKDGKFYGVTFSGGQENLGTIYVLKQTGKTQTLHSFRAIENIAFPCDGMTMAFDRSLYGTAAACKDGTCAGSAIFELTAKGDFKVLHAFDPATDGTEASGALFLDTNGLLYGLTESGGPNGGGTAYSFDNGLAPFASLSPASGAVGDTINVYGQGFTEKGTKIFFGKTLASHNFYVGPNYDRVEVPQGATTGTVTVKTPSSKLKSIQTFTVSH